MKFGKTFEKKVIEEWNAYSLDYESLKTILKDEEKKDYVITEDEQRRFFEIIEQSKTKLEKFYEEQQQWATKKTNDLESRVKSLSDEKQREEVLSLLLEFEFELGFVLQFFQLNLTGFSKILKKYDKRTGSIVREFHLAKLKKTHPFLEGDMFEEIRVKSSKLRTSVEQKELHSISDDVTIQHEKKIITKTEKHHLLIQRKSENYISSILEKSRFFKKNKEKSLAEFSFKEIVSGKKLGEGEYSIVKEIQEFLVNENCHICFLHRGFDHLKALQNLGENTIKKESNNGGIVVHTPPSSPNMDQEVSFEEQTFQSDEVDSSDGDNFESDHGDDEMLLVTRGFMNDHCIRRGLTRYAVKTLKPSLKGRELAEASLDLAMEAKFLAVLNHPNIVKIRGSYGVLGHPNFQIILDRLYFTLEEQCKIWSVSMKNSKKVLGIYRSNKENYNNLWTERLVTAFDISRALNYLHKHKIIFRDLKPQNIGYDIRGNAKIFDFGLAKELLEEDKVGEDQYMASGLTGSRRYMAPEVVTCKPYGYSADVYSFAIVLWEIFTLKIPFEKYSYEEHKKLVVYKGKRLKIPSSWSIEMKEIIPQCWAQKPFLRPSFFTICQNLKSQVDSYDQSIDLNGRTHRLLDTSVSSRLGNNF